MRRPSIALQALIFDAYGTLFDVHSVISECDILFPGHGPALSELWRSRQLQYTWLRTLMDSYVDFWQVTADALEFACRALDLPYTAAVRDRLLGQYLTLKAFPEVPSALRALHSSYRLAILSNGTPAMLEGVAGHCGVRVEFDALLSVDAVKAFKPDPRPYAYALRALQLPVSAVGFISSNPFDVCGAGRFGFTTFWIHRHPAPFDILGVQPDLEIANLTELVGWVQK